MDNGPDYHVLLYSKFSAPCKQLDDIMVQSRIDFSTVCALERVCIDNKEVRQRILANSSNDSSSSSGLRVDYVPCILGINKRTSTIEKYDRKEAFEWVQDIISQYQYQYQHQQQLGGMRQHFPSHNNNNDTTITTTSLAAQSSGESKEDILPTHHQVDSGNITTSRQTEDAPPHHNHHQVTKLEMYHNHTSDGGQEEEDNNNGLLQQQQQQESGSGGGEGGVLNNKPHQQVTPISAPAAKAPNAGNYAMGKNVRFTDPPVSSRPSGKRVPKGVVDASIKKGEKKGIDKLIQEMSRQREDSIKNMIPPPPGMSTQAHAQAMALTRS